MALLFKSAWDDAGEWTRCIQAEEPELEVRVWPEVGEATDIDAHEHIELRPNRNAGAHWLYACLASPEATPHLKPGRVDPGT